MKMAYANCVEGKQSKNVNIFGSYRSVKYSEVKV